MIKYYTVPSEHGTKKLAEIVTYAQVRYIAGAFLQLLSAGEMGDELGELENLKI
jgi:hypothetical protein